MNPGSGNPARSLLIFGATGDLSRRMLLPSLFGLHLDGLIEPEFRIVASARSDMDPAAFREATVRAIEAAVPMEHARYAAIHAFLSRITYVPADIGRAEDFAGLAASLDGRSQDLAIFLSTAAPLFEPICRGLSDAGLTGAGTRIALEKPLGKDLASSQLINDAVLGVFPEERVFRIDHYLGKEPVQNLLALRFGNILFDPLWNADGIEQVQITVSETVGLEGRGDYYDDVGALRDMVQNHLLQLLTMIAMEPPARFDPRAIRDEKVKVLRALRPIDETNVERNCVTGQYAAGAVAGAEVPGYAADLGSASDTETYVALRVNIDNWRWNGVPFHLRTGKRMPVREAEIVVRFREVPHAIFGRTSPALNANKLVMRLQPDESIRLLMMMKEAGLDRQGIRLREAPLNLSLTETLSGGRQRLAYERLLLDFIEDDPTLFVRRDEVEAQWQWIDTIRQAWIARGMKPEPYAAGTPGPESALRLIESGPDRVNG